MRSVADSEQWKTIDRMYLKVLTNLCLGIVGNDIVPFKNTTIKQSTWVLLITIYNLLPWLLTKKIHIICCVNSRPKLTNNQ
jgi:hypothetical protein